MARIRNPIPATITRLSQKVQSMPIRVTSSPPRVHRHRCHGVFAPNATWKREATRHGREHTIEVG